MSILSRHKVTLLWQKNCYLLCTTTALFLFFVLPYFLCSMTIFFLVEMGQCDNQDCSAHCESMPNLGLNIQLFFVQVMLNIR